MLRVLLFSFIFCLHKEVWKKNIRTNPYHDVCLWREWCHVVLLARWSRTTNPKTLAAWDVEKIGVDWKLLSTAWCMRNHSSFCLCFSLDDFTRYVKEFWSQLEVFKGQKVNEITSLRLFFCLFCDSFLDKRSMNSCNWKKHAPATRNNNKKKNNDMFTIRILIFFLRFFFIPGMSKENIVAISPFSLDDLIFICESKLFRVIWLG